ncbi:unnamed protein product [Spirodela intermedia]|uniref:Uncharacterized protein n=1 Tax=Spirodela intermedia TaxID=51605 RepID=A0A7I8JLT3_SPIIN|nr:unnamed protein product [Spirodela intermedia]CAA6670775.1 unnamed protein product [Spirodela intermedia]
MDILALSYADLPHHLKWCFLYFSSFPEDYKIGVNKLIRLWIAEGFIEHREGETLEESAEGHLEELVRRCMVTIVQVEYCRPMAEGRQRCRIHDLLHDFTIAEAKEAGFLVCHRISDGRDTFPALDLKLLRVIDLEDAPLAVLPEEVGDLIHLRFLGMRGTRIRSLPSSVGKLPHLQCLDVLGRRSKRCRELCGRSRPYGTVSSSRAVVFATQVVRLKKLKLDGVSIPACQWTLPSFSSLEFLYLRGEVVRPQQPSSGGHQWPPNLTELALSGTRLDRDSIEAIEKLPELRVLYLGPGSYTGNEMICPRGGFPLLQSLELHSLAELESWVAEAGAMSHLRSLKIFSCRKLAMLPEGLQHMVALKDLTLWDMPPEFCSRALWAEGEDWPKIRHIPSLTIL